MAGWLLLGVSLAVHAATPDCARVLVTRSDGVGVWFEVEIADTAAARTRGLMHRETLPARHGMWFDFGRAQAVTMWMKNTQLPLDMLFVDASGRVISIAKDTVPGSLARIESRGAARYVLEINAGEAARFAVTAGAQARLRWCAARAQGAEGVAEATQ